MSFFAVRWVHLLPGVAWVAFVGCQSHRFPEEPHHYFAITHPALNRITFFDLERREVVGALPTEKLPHDMLLGRNGNVLYVVNSGAQCISSYNITDQEMWQVAAAFMKSDSSGRRSGSPAMMGPRHGAARDTASETYLRDDPVQHLPASVVVQHLSDPMFPPQAAQKHRPVGAETHKACFDCHDRSVGGKPFGPIFGGDKSEIYLVHLAYKNLTVLDASTLTVKRQIPLDSIPNLSPIAVWVNSEETYAFITCRAEIGASLPGCILVVDLKTGKTSKFIPAGIYPWHLLPDASGKTLYVNNFQSSTISVVDVARQEIVDSLTAQNGPAMMVLVPNTNLLLVSCFYTDNIVAVNTHTHQTEKVIHVDTNPTSMEVADDGTKLYVLCGGESSLVVVDLRSYQVIERFKLLFGAYAFQQIDRTNLY